MVAVAVVQAEAFGQIDDPFAVPFAVEPVVFAEETHDDDAAAVDEIDVVEAYKLDSCGPASAALMWSHVAKQWRHATN